MRYRQVTAAILGGTIVGLLSGAAAAPAAQSAQYQILEWQISSCGTSVESGGRRLECSVGEPVVGAAWGRVWGLQAGWLNSYTIAAPGVPTPTPQVRYFGGEVLSPEFVYAAPNPIRGRQGAIYFDLAAPAEVSLRLYTAGNDLVLSRHWDRLPAGGQRWVWDAGNMANGIYVLWLQARGEDGKRTLVKKKIALIK